jgi:predicted kinase
MNNTVYVMVGISGSGKSTFIKSFLNKNPNVVVYSSDKLRAVLGKSEEDQTVSGQVFSTIKYNLDRDLALGKDVMIDATSLNPKERRDYVTVGKKYGAKLTAYVLERDRETLIRNQQKRKSEGGREVPDFVIDRMISKYVRPSRDEGFDDIILV